MSMNRRNFLKLTAAATAIPLASKAEWLEQSDKAEPLYVELELFGKRWPIAVVEESGGIIRACGDLVIYVEEDSVIEPFATMHLGNVWPAIQAMGKTSVEIPLTPYAVHVNAGDSATIRWDGPAVMLS